MVSVGGCKCYGAKRLTHLRLLRRNLEDKKLASVKTGIVKFEIDTFAKKLENEGGPVQSIHGHKACDTAQIFKEMNAHVFGETKPAKTATGQIQHIAQIDPPLSIWAAELYCTTCKTNCDIVECACPSSPARYSHTTDIETTQGRLKDYRAEWKRFTRSLDVQTWARETLPLCGTYWAATLDVSTPGYAKTWIRK